MEDIEPKELKERLDRQEQLNIIDVREAFDYEESNIATSKNIPLHELPAQIPVMEELKTEEVIVHCNSGDRSKMAKMLLEQAGFNNVRNLNGGIKAYKEL